MWMSQKVLGRLASASTMPALQAVCETPTLTHKQAQCGRGWTGPGSESVKSRTRLGGRGGVGVV